MNSNGWRAARARAIANVDPAYIGASIGYWRNCMLGYLVDYRVFGARTIQRIIRTTWITRGRISVKGMGDIYVIHCENNQDLADLRDKSVASFKGALMVFTPWHPGWVPRTVRFPMACLWFMVEEFEEILDNDFLGIRVCLYLNELLSPGFFLAYNEGTKRKTVSEPTRFVSTGEDDSSCSQTVEVDLSSPPSFKKARTGSFSYAGASPRGDGLAGSTSRIMLIEYEDSAILERMEMVDEDHDSQSIFSAPTTGSAMIEPFQSSTLQ
ncbi:hypothetical protein RND81_06G109700 [Saponaria officinalis]|uniref:DUF4283 domain-containing protein n=1 Tax=Saponaria officinalis TaxID=3572 RepID=A0AAW1K971_SAPOF